MKLPPELKKEVDQIISQHEFKQGALLPILHKVQEKCGYLVEDVLAGVAEYLNIPQVDVFEIATFYTLFNTRPVGKNIILVCDSISCYLLEGETILTHLENKLGIKAGETTADGKFTLGTTSCIGACGRAPAMMINDKTYFELTPEKIGKILREYSIKKEHITRNVSTLPEGRVYNASIQI
jgi:NADH-quinone oxidoreductase E subunit